MINSSLSWMDQQRPREAPAQAVVGILTFCPIDHGTRESFSLVGGVNSILCAVSHEF